MLVLPLRSADNEYLKKYLAERLKQERRKLQDTTQQLTDTVSELESVTLQRDGILTELEKQKVENQSITTNLTLDEQRKINELQDGKLKEQTEMQAKFENDKRVTMERYEEKILKLTGKNEELELRLQNATEVERRLESSSLSLQNALAEATTLKQEMKQMTEYRVSDSKEITSANLKVTQYEAQLESQAKELENKEQMIQTHKILVTSTQNEKDQILDKLQTVQANFDKATKKLSKCVEDINYGNSCIGKLQDKLKVQKEKYLHQREDVKRIYAEREARGRHIEELNTEVERRDYDISKSERETEELKGILSENKKALEKNEELIQYLQKQLNEAKMGVPQSSTAFQTSKFTPSMGAYSTMKSGYTPPQPGPMMSAYKPPTINSSFKPSGFTSMAETLDRDKPNASAFNSSSFTSSQPMSRDFTSSQPMSSGFQSSAYVPKTTDHDNSTITSVAGTYSMMKRTPSQTSLQSSISAGTSLNSISQLPFSDGSGGEQYVKEEPFEPKDTARSNNNTATFVEDKENQEANMMSLPMQLQNSVGEGLPSNFLQTNVEITNEGSDLDESCDFISPVPFQMQ